MIFGAGPRGQTSLTVGGRVRGWLSMSQDDAEGSPLDVLVPPGKRKKKKQVSAGAMPVALLLAEVEKQYGAGVILRASKLKSVALPRIQTTVFPFDLAL